MMLKLACPKCRLKLRIPEEKVPVAGAWAQCPRCAERFFINPAASSLDDLTRPFTRGGQPAAGTGGPSRYRDESSQKLLGRMKVKQGGLDEADYRHDLITVYPQPAVPGYVYQAVSAILLCLPLAAVFLLFNAADSRLDQAEPRPEPVTTAVERLNDQDVTALIRQDLLNIKRDHIMRRRGLYGVGYSGGESRVFKYFMHRLAPNYCSAISYLRVSVPAPPSNGFSATALCLEPEGRRLEMRVEWLDARYSRISFPYNGRSERFMIRDEVEPLIRPHP